MRKVLSGLIAILTVTVLIGFTSYAEGDTDSEPVLHKMRATAYCYEGRTYTGKPVRKGICAAGNKDLIGKTVILYQRLPNGDIGDYIGIYEVEDTGCNEYVIDVWMPEAECQDFMRTVYENGCGGKIWVQVVSATG